MEFGVITSLTLIASVFLWTAIYFRIRYLETRFPALDSAPPLTPPPEGWPPVSIILPARNEERDLAATLEALWRQDYPDFEIILVDDQSTDATATVAETSGQGRAGFTLIRGKPRPSERWVGKNWALVQGAAVARHEWLLFMDADVVAHPLALKQAMAAARLHQADALSILPAITCRTVWEKTVMPLFALLSALVEPMDRVNRPGKTGARLSGAFILTRCAAYEAVGGHRAVAGQLIEDLALARNFKRHGFSIRLLWTHDLISTRMFDTFRDLWTGLVRLGYPMLEYSPPRLLLAWLAALVGAWGPWIALAVGTGRAMRGRAGGLVLALSALALVLATPRILRSILKLLRVKRPWAWLLPAAAALYCMAATASAVRHYTGRGVTWKNRSYRPGV